MTLWLFLKVENFLQKISLCSNQITKMILIPERFQQKCAENFLFLFKKMLSGLMPENTYDDFDQPPLAIIFQFFLENVA